MPDEIQRKINAIRSAVFTGKGAEAVNLTAQLFEILLQNDKHYADFLQKIFLKALKAAEHKDYLLLADIVAFEIPKIYR